MLAFTRVPVISVAVKCSKTENLLDFWHEHLPIGSCKGTQKEDSKYSNSANSSSAWKGLSYLEMMHPHASQAYLVRRVFQLSTILSRALCTQRMLKTRLEKINLVSCCGLCYGKITTLSLIRPVDKFDLPNLIFLFELSDSVFFFFLLHELSLCISYCRPHGLLGSLGSVYFKINKFYFGFDTKYSTWPLNSG